MIRAHYLGEARDEKPRVNGHPRSDGLAENWSEQHRINQHALMSHAPETVSRQFARLNRRIHGPKVWGIFGLR